MTTSKPHSDPQGELLARLGLDDRATAEDVAETHDQLVAFLTTAPKSLRAWARTQAQAADEAFAILTDPDAPAAPGALSGPAERPTVQPDEPATPPARRAPPAAAAAATELSPAEKTFEEMLAEVTPGTHRESLPSAKTVADGPAGPATGATDGPGRPRGSSRFSIGRVVAVGAIVVAAAGIAIGGYQLGSAAEVTAQTPASPGPQATAGIDQAVVADLMAKVQADPKDTASLMRLGDEFYIAGDFETAASWFQKVLDVDAEDMRARLALGAAYFNLGDMTNAETAWTAVVKQDPTNVEAHYDLGFLYLNQDPPDMAGVQREWGEVVRLAPDSDVAQTVKSHLDALSSPAPSGAPASDPSTGPTAPSAAPSGSARP